MVLDLPQGLQKSWVIFEALRRLGFPAADIFFHVGDRFARRGYEVFVILRAQHKTFAVTTGFVDLKREKIEELWTTFAEKLSEETEADLNAVLERLLPVGESIGLLSAMLDRGFYFPSQTS